MLPEKLRPWYESEEHNGTHNHGRYGVAGYGKGQGGNEGAATSGVIGRLCCNDSLRDTRSEFLGLLGARFRRRVAYETG